MLEKCLDCSESPNEVLNCKIISCPLHPIRLSKCTNIADREDLQLFKAKCLDCCCNQIEKVKQCLVKRCPLYEYRKFYYKNRKDDY
jgi:hypothetical protein